MSLSDYPDVGKVADVAAVLDCDPRTVYALIEEGRLDAVRLGRNLRVTRVALMALSLARRLRIEQASCRYPILFPYTSSYLEA